MLKLAFARSSDSAPSILCVGAHSDDIEIGCGGTVLRLLDEWPQAFVQWIVLSAPGQRRNEALSGAKCFLADARRSEVVVKDFQDGFFPYIGGEIKRYFEALKRVSSPDLIFTHCRSDLHQDHRLVCELTWNTFRNHTILEYEVAKYDGDLGMPNFFVPLTAATSERKAATILECFATQRDKSWFTRETFLALSRIRGIECNAPEGLAEAFYCRKMVY